MNDNIIIWGLAYIMLASLFIGFMPTEFFSGVVPTSLDSSEMQGDIPTSTLTIGKGFGFWGKILTFIFVPIAITGLPLFISGLLQIIHLILMISFVIYGVKLFWSGV